MLQYVSIAFLRKEGDATVLLSHSSSGLCQSTFSLPSAFCTSPSSANVILEVITRAKSIKTMKTEQLYLGHIRSQSWLWIMTTDIDISTKKKYLRRAERTPTKKTEAAGYEVS